ncbi:hypothetical protein VPH35_039717 [Triticum aestivum]
MVPARWDQLPDDIVRSIHARLPCPVDGVYMALVCTQGRNQARGPVCPAAAPALASPPLAQGPSFACIMSGGGRHTLDLPEDARRARFFGSYEGRWLFLALRRTEGHVLLNLRTRERIPLPDVEYGEIRLVGQGANRSLVRGPPRPVVMLAATLSSAPAVDGGGCVAAAILTMQRRHGTGKWRYVCFWRLGSRLAINQEEINSTCGTSPQDIVYFDGRFLVLTKGEHLRAYTVLDEPDAIRGGDLRVECRLYVTGRDKKMQDGESRAGYLVESRGELLMVVKEWMDDGAVSCIQVFVLAAVPHDNPQLTCVWTRVERLDGRLLVISPGCSRAYECVDFSAGCVAEGVYFLDDRTYYNTTYFGAYFNLQTNSDEFTCTDNGSCSLLPASPDQCFPRKPREGLSSSYSPPVWLLH